MHFRFLLLLLLLTTTSAHSQLSYQEDKTPRLLFDSNYQPIRTYAFSELDFPDEVFLEYEQIWGEYPDVLVLPTIYVDLCKEQRHANGILKSRCECVDNQLHGKAVFWDEKGRIQSVQVFRKGHLYREKIYSEGELTDVINYTYVANEQVLHGTNIEIREDEKTIHNYKYGVRHGLETETTAGVKTRELFYDNGIIIKGRWWNKKGVLMREEFKTSSGESMGKWYKFDAKRNTETYTTYENGQMVLLETFRNGTLVRKSTNLPSGLFVNNNFYDDGTPFMRHTRDSSNKLTYDYFNEFGDLISSYEIRDNRLLDTGFHFNGQHTVHFKALEDSEHRPLLHCYTLKNGDTTSFFYAPNEGTIGFKPIATNQFVQKNGKAVKHGLWLTYENNKLLHKINFLDGVQHGEAVYFDTSGIEPTPYLHARYKNGLKDGEWLYRSSSLFVRCNFENGVRHGMYEKHRRIADTLYLDSKKNYTQKESNRMINEKLTLLYACHFQNDSLNGDFKSCTQYGKVRWRGQYLHNKKTGLWEQVTASGTVEKSGNFENGITQKNWTEPTLNKRGKIKEVKIDPPKETISDTFLLKSGQLLQPKEP